MRATAIPLRMGGPILLRKKLTSVLDQETGSTSWFHAAECGTIFNGVVPVPSLGDY
jgi:hypothetical protein